MLRSTVLLPGICGWLALLLLAPDPAHGQAKPSDKTKVGRLPVEGSQKLVDDFDDRPKARLFRALYSGEEKNVEKHKEIIDTAAKYYAYSLTWFDVYKSDPDKYRKIVREAGDVLDAAIKKKPEGTEPFVQLFTKLLATYLKDVVPNSFALADVNAGLLFYRLAETGYYPDELADLFTKILKDPNYDQSPALRYWVLKGMGKVIEPMFNDRKLKDKAPAAILTLLDVLKQECAREVPSAPPEEIGGIHWFRREAVRALAATQLPAVADAKGKIEGPTALALLKVVRNDGLKLPARIDEQLEAAIGVARLQSKRVEGYQPDYAVHELARFVVDLANQQQGAAGRDKERQWKIYAARLTEALEEMKNDAAANKKLPREVTAHVNDVVEQCKPILSQMERGTAVNPAKLGDWLGRVQPKSDSLYQGVKDAVVKPAEEK